LRHAFAHIPEHKEIVLIFMPFPNNGFHFFNRLWYFFNRVGVNGKHYYLIVTREPFLCCCEWHEDHII